MGSTFSYFTNDSFALRNHTEDYLYTMYTQCTNVYEYKKLMFFIYNFILTSPPVNHRKLNPDNKEM